MVKLKPLAEQVIVITGASSGIGLATAKAAAAGGAKVVLAARTRDALIQSVDEINQANPDSASFVEADVGTHEEHERIAAHAIERHGRIDTWINNAGVLVFGKLEELPEADMRQLFETNFWGVVHGSLVAARHLRAQGGALINLGSLESDRGVPLQGIYVASKHAVKGFTEVLRMELEHDKAPISVTLVKPGAIATPLVHHTRSFEGNEPQLPPPLYTPEEAARNILRAAVKPTRQTYVGGAARFGSAFAAIAPRALDWISEALLVRGQISDRPADGRDNVDTGQSEARVSGPQTGRPSLYSAAARNPAVTMAVAGGLVAAGALLLRRRGGDEPVENGAAQARRPELAVVRDEEQIPVEGN